MVVEALESLQEGVEELFDYNRENFFFDQEQNIKREYQEQDMRVKKFVLYREDVRDLMQLTTGKMDSYILPVVLLLGVCFLFLVHGDLHEPHIMEKWLMWLYVINLAESFLYLFLSAWFVIHASISAHSFGVRLLTQFVRLPVPNRQQLDAARRYAAEFEAEGFSGMLRVPVWKKQMERLDEDTRASLERINARDQMSATRSPRGNEFEMVSETDDAAGVGAGCLQNDAAASVGSASAAAGASTTYSTITSLRSSEEVQSSQVDLASQGDGYLVAGGALANMQALRPVLSLKHVRLYRELQANWQAHDAYARACMALGTYTLTQAQAYYLLGLYVVENDAPGPALMCSFTMVCLGWLLVKLDIWFRTRCFVFVTLTMISAPIVAVVAMILQRNGGSFSDWHLPLVPLIYLLNALLIIAIAYVAHAEQIKTEESAPNVALPTRFRTVLFLDVFGWMSDSQNDDDSAASGSPPNSPRTSRRNSRTVSPEVLPEDVRKQLYFECQSMASEIRTELEAWETEGVVRNYAAIPGFADGIRQLRGEYDMVVRELADIGSPTASGAFSSSGSFQLVEDPCVSSPCAPSRGSREEDDSRPAQPTMWVSLKWTSSNSLVEYFVNPQTGEACSDLPEEALVSDSEILADRLAQLAEQVETLKTSAPPPREQQRLRTPSFNLGSYMWRGRSTSRSQSCQPADSSGEAASVGRETSDSSVVSSSTSGVSGIHNWARQESNVSGIADLASNSSNVSLQRPSAASVDRGSRCSPNETTFATVSTAATFNESQSSAQGDSLRVTIGDSRASFRTPSPIAERIAERRRSASPIFTRDLRSPSPTLRTVRRYSSSPEHVTQTQTASFRRRSTGGISLSLQEASREPGTWSMGSDFASPDRQPMSFNGIRRVAEEEQPSTTQEMQFGGREAANVAGRDTPAFSHSESAALTFHPQFHPRQDGRRESKRLPGQVPWTAFMCSSAVLVSVWLMGFGFYAIHPLASNDPLSKAESSESAEKELNVSSLSGGLMVLSAHRWFTGPVPVQPVGFTCTADGVALIAEQYRVHQLRLDITEGLEPRLSLAVERCLSEQPDFHSSGLAGISLECSSRGDDCTVILLGVHGRQVLYCPLDVIHRRPPQQGAASVIRLAQRFAAVTGFRHEADGPRRWWGSASLGQGSTRLPWQLQVQFNARSGPRAFPVSAVSNQSWSSLSVEKAHPQAAEPSPVFLGAAANRSPRAESLRIEGAHSCCAEELGTNSLHMHGQTGLLGISQNGKLLHAWEVPSEEKRKSARAPPAQGPVPLGSWRFPKGSRWSGICTTRNHLYALRQTVTSDAQDPGEDAAERGVPEIWQFDLPGSISRLRSLTDSFM